MTDAITLPVTTTEAAPQIDHQALINSTAKAAADAAGALIEKKSAEIANAKLKEFGKQLAGEPQEDPKERFLKELVNDPGRVLGAVKDSAKREAKSEIREEDSRNQAVKNVQREVVGKAIEEYPELKQGHKLSLLEKLAEDYEGQGKSYRDALDLATKDVVKEFGLKSVSEEQRAGNYAYGVPGGGGHSPGSPVKNEAQSNSDFLSAMRARAASVRKKS